MKVHVTIVRADGQPLPPGSPVRVEIRDTSLADAPAVMLKRKAARVPKTGSMSVAIDLTTVPDGTTVWVHVDVDRDGRVSRGDFVSVQSYPITDASTAKPIVEVKQVS
jgi:uncharacterized lipoprotein YbaY